MTFSAVLAFLQTDLALRLLISAFCGAIIGAERELIGKPAGVRTCALVCLGSALFAMIGTLLVGDVVDIGRIGSNVVQGIGFIGGGVIFFFKDKLLGITTAAVIWVAAAVGLAIGFGFLDLGIFTTILVLTILVFIGFIERQFFKTKRKPIKKRRKYGQQI